MSVNTNLYVEKVHSMISLIKEYISESRNIISLINPNLLGKTADYINELEMLFEKLNYSTLQELLNVFNTIDNIQKIAMELINNIKPESIIKEVILGRSFTYIESIKKQREHILEYEQILTTEYETLYSDLINKLKTFLTPTTVDEFILKLDKNNRKVLFRLTDIDFIVDNKRANEIMYEIKTDLIKPDLEPNDTISIIMRTWANFGVAEDTSPSNTVFVCTGQSITYNLQGLTCAGWVAKNKLGEDKMAGLSPEFIKRLTLINKNPPGVYNISADKPILKISYCSEKFNTIEPPLLYEFITIGKILGDNIMSNMTINPPVEVVEDVAKRAEDIMARIKINMSGAINKWVRTLSKEKISNEDLLKSLMKPATEAIRDALTISEDLLLIYSVMMECTKRFESYMRNEINKYDDLFEKENLLEIMQFLANGGVNEINRQPSPLEQL